MLTDSTLAVSRQNIANNAAWAVLLVAFNVLALLALYKILLVKLGIEALGLYSAVAAVVGIIRLGDLGVGAATVRHVSLFLAEGNPGLARSAIETGSATIAVVLGALSVLMWLLLPSVLPRLIPSEHLAMATGLVGPMLFATWLGSIAAGLSMGLDGCHRADLRCKIAIASQLVLVASSVVLLQRYGLLGLVFAQVVQAGVVLVLSSVLLARRFGGAPLQLWRWSRATFSKIWRYGGTFQILTILSMLGEPLIKLLLTHFGSLSTVGYFELANRVASLARAPVAAMNQVTVSHYSAFSQLDPKMVAASYIASMQITLLATSIIFSTLVCILPFIGGYWLGQPDAQFLRYGYLQSAAWAINCLSIPAYFAMVGLGMLHVVLYSAAAVMVTTALLGAAGGFLLGAFGCAAASVIAMVMGSSVLMFHFHRQQGLRLGDVIDKQSTGAVVLALAIAVILPTMMTSIADGNRIAAVAVSLIVPSLAWTVFLACTARGRTLVATIAKRVNGLRQPPAFQPEGGN
jgi:O-antigen/teichoic acid export membrane protein